MSTWLNRLKDPIAFLLMESLDFLLFEDGTFMILEQTGRDAPAWNLRTKH